MKRNLIYGMLIAAAMLMGGTAFSSPQSEGIYSEPTYDTVALTSEAVVCGYESEPVNLPMKIPISV